MNRDIGSFPDVSQETVLTPSLSSLSQGLNADTMGEYSTAPPPGLNDESASDMYYGTMPMEYSSLQSTDPNRPRAQYIDAESVAAPRAPGRSSARPRGSRYRAYDPLVTLGYATAAVGGVSGEMAGTPSAMTAGTMDPRSGWAGPVDDVMGPGAGQGGSIEIEYQPGGWYPDADGDIAISDDEDLPQQPGKRSKKQGRSSPGRSSISSGGSGGSIRNNATNGSSRNSTKGPEVQLRTASRKSKRHPASYRPPTSPKEQRARNCHNEVEKKYRGRINAQFERLLAALPVAREGDGEEGGDVFIIDAQRRLSKAEVLDLACRHIRSLERETAGLEVEKETLEGTIGRMSSKAMMGR